MAGLDQLRSRALQLAHANDFGTQAEQINREILSRDPSDTSAMNRLARCLRKRGAFDEAIAIYTGVVALQPDNNVAINGLADLLPKLPLARAKTGRKAHVPFAPTVGDISIPDDEALRFAEELKTNRYERHERL